jgi:hypothetical protein
VPALYVAASALPVRLVLAKALPETAGRPLNDIRRDQLDFREPTTTEPTQQED